MKTSAFLKYCSLLLLLFCINIQESSAIHPLEEKAQSYITKGDFTQAIHYFKKAQQTYHKQQNEEGLESALLCYRGIAYCFYQQEQYDSLKAYIDIGFEYIQKNELSNTRAAAYFHQTAVLWYEYAGQYNKAFSATKKSMAIFGKDDHDFGAIAENHNNLGSIYRRFADFETALYHFHQALNYAPNNRLGLYQRNIGVLLSEKGDYTTAVRRLRESLGHAQSKQDSISNYSNLGILYTELGNCEDGLRELKKAATLLGDVKNIESRVVSLGLALAYSCQKEYAKAIYYANLSIESRVKIHGKKHTVVGKAYYEKATIYVAQKKHKKALKTYQNALTSLVKDFESTDIEQNPKLDSILSNPVLLKTLVGKAESMTALNYSPDKILNTYLVATDLIDSMRTNFAMDESKYDLTEKSIAIYEATIEWALKLKKIELAFQISEKSKAGILLETLKKLGSTQYLNSTTEKEQSYADFQAALEAKSPSYYTIRQLRVADIQKELDSEQAMIVYFVGEKKIYFFVIDNQDIQVFSFNKTSSWKTNIKDLNNALNHRTCTDDEYQNYGTIASSLYQQLLAPIEKLSNYKRLLIIPDELLSFVPFDALLTTPPTRKEQRFHQLAYVLKNHSIGYAYSANVWLEHKRQKDNRPANPYNIAGFAPSFLGEKINQKRSGGLSKLRYTKESVQTICKNLGNKSFLDEDATIENFKKEANNYEIIHVATHASSSHEHGIHFSEKMLKLSAIYELSLSSKLIVLSACQTGTGKLKRGEGVMSLARAFTHAGCPSTVMSLWKVNDESTGYLMVQFHEYLAKGMPQDEALQLAKLDYLADITKNGKNQADANPYYWAGFVQLGDSESLNSSGSNYWVYWGVLIGVLLTWMVRRKIQSSKFKN